MLRAKINITFTKTHESEASIAAIPPGSTNVSFTFCNEIETESSYQNLTDTAKIIIPRKLTMIGLNLFAGDDPIFKRGDRVKIETGYYPILTTIFTGYISKVSANIPVEVHCEDQMFLLKQYTVTYPSKFWVQTKGKSGKFLKRPKVITENITLKELCDYMIQDDIPYKLLDDIKLGQFRVTNATPCKVLEKLQSEYGLFSYFVDGVLNIGFANDAADTKEAEFVMEEVIINSNELDFQTSTDFKLKVKAISMLPDNNKIEIDEGDPDGQQKTMHYYNIKTEAELRVIAKKYIAEYKYTGFRGRVETFGEPVLRHGDRCKIVSKVLPERNGTYLIESVKRSMSVTGGYRQFFDIGVKVA